MEKLVVFQNQGQNLYGMLHLPEGPTPCPAVALLHGFTGHRSESHFIFTKQARHLAQHGIAALRFDFRGSGESEGDFADMTIEGEISDAAAALDWLSAQPEIDKARLGVLGLSLGGLVAACLAGRDPRVRALVLWAAPANLAEVLTKGAANASRPPAPHPSGYDIGGLVIGHEFIRQMMAVRPLDELRRFAGPTLVVQGTGDASVPPDDAHKYMQALTGPKALKVIEGADHTFSSVAWEKEVITASTQWFAQHL
jgi:dipeptidyl aminopeptidase/acylaminoacyl peptidase